MAENLLSEIEEFLSETGMKEYTFGFHAARNGRLIERLRAGATPIEGRPVRIWPETAKQIRDFMRTERRTRARAKQSVAS
jgi:hypothetical protein